MNNPELINLRADLSLLNEDLFKLYSNRQKIINKIQNLKVSLELKSWDPSREFELFKSLNFSNDLALATSYSLLIESQVNSIIDYPKWSKGEHLLAQSGSLIDFINPILLFILNKSQYNSLKLKPEYQSILDEVLK